MDDSGVGAGAGAGAGLLCGFLAVTLLERLEAGTRASSKISGVEKRTLRDSRLAAEL